MNKLRIKRTGRLSELLKVKHLVGDEVMTGKKALFLRGSMECDSDYFFIFGFWKIS